MKAKNNKRLTEPGNCFLCGVYTYLETHEIFGGALRQKSMRYGLQVPLCASCHREGKHAVEKDHNVAQALHEYGQRKAMEENGWTIADFRREFYKNYLEGEDCDE